MFLRDKKFFSKGIVVDTKEDNNISKKIWKDISFLEKRNLMIFLEKIEPIELEFDVCVPTLIEPNIPNAYFFLFLLHNRRAIKLVAAINKAYAGNKCRTL